MTFPALIRNYLTQVRVPERQRVNAHVRELYDSRVKADYRVLQTTDRAAALRCVLLAERVLELLGVING